MRRRYNLLQTNAAHGIYDFTGVYTQNLITPAKTGIGVADVLLGAPADGNINSLAGTRGYRRWEIAFFAEDSWKLTPSLTLNWGLRYDAFPSFPWVETHDRMSNFLPSLGNVYVVGSTQIPQRSATNSDGKNLGPRIGLAYKLGSRTVLRAAYGVFYEAESIPETNLPGANPPFSGSVAFTNNKADFAGAMKVAQGFPAPVTNLYPTAGAVLYGIDPNLRIPYAQQWNAGVRREFSGNMIVSASYVGTKGTSLILQPDINQAFPGAGAVNLRRPFPNFSAITTVESAGSSTFHSLQASAEKRLSKGVSFLLSYTWSQAIANGDFLAAPQNSQNLAGTGAAAPPMCGRGWSGRGPGLRRAAESRSAAGRSTGLPVSTPGCRSQ
jgi:outer membrane receptor protein involved in Fe transport